MCEERRSVAPAVLTPETMERSRQAGARNRFLMLQANLEKKFKSQEEQGMDEVFIATDLEKVKFFAGIGKAMDNVHSFIILGFVENGRQEILHKFGKWGQLRGGKIQLRSELRPDEQLQEGVMYVERRGKKLSYVLARAESGTYEGELGIDLEQEELTNKWLRNNRARILRETSKIGVTQQDRGPVATHCATAFSSIEAEICEEMSWLVTASSRVSLEMAEYSEEITFDEYRHFLEFICSELKYHSKMYLPYQLPESKTVVWTLQEVRATSNQRDSQLSKKEEETLRSAQKLAIGNTCRNTAIDMLHCATGVVENNALTQNVSTLFLCDLPVKKKFVGEPIIEDDKIIGHRVRSLGYSYVFPGRPQRNKDVGKFALLTKIYNRMSDLIKKEIDSSLTYDKFKALTELYKECQEASLENIPSIVLEWKEKYGAIIRQLRSPCFFSRTFNLESSTAEMIKEIERSLEMQETSILRFCPSFEDMVFRF